MGRQNERFRNVNCSNEVGVLHHGSVLVHTETRGEIVTEVIGRLITDLQPKGTVRIVFLQHVGSGYERPLIAQNLDRAENEFIHTLGLTRDKAAALRAQLERDKMADAVISVDAGVAATFRNQPLRKD